MSFSHFGLSFSRVILSSFFVLLSTGAFANGLTVSNLSRDSMAQTVTFDIQWFNSWRLNGVQAPNNWDAAWVFVKFLPCGSSPTTAWEHGVLDATLANHNFGTLEAVLSDGSGTGLDTDRLGVMLRRSATGLFGNEAATSITLHIPNMLQNTSYHLRVLGVEMVFVPQEAYELGAVSASNSFAATTTSSDTNPVTILNENAITVNSHASGVNATVSLSAAFPKGYAAFHCMKYEISQGQYADFLNCLAPAIQYNRYTGNFNSYRNQLHVTGTNAIQLFGSDREDRAQNYMGWDDLAAYLDWAALRPITEMEYEKSCRGSVPGVLDELAWGSTNQFQLTEITGPENGTEIPQLLPANAHYINNAMVGGDAGYGPVRCGIFALPTNTTREQSGAGYYGIMELSGNIWESCVGVLSTTSTAGPVAFTSAPGDGVLAANGDANQATWPSVATGGYIVRGGSWSSTAPNLRISHRNLSWNGLRANDRGGRGCR